MLTILHGDALTKLAEVESESVQTCVTSPPYWGLRDYGVDGQLGLEKTPEEYAVKLVEIFRDVKRVLRKDGTLWVNLGDSYFGGISAGRQPKDSDGAEAARQQKTEGKNCQECGSWFVGYPRQRFCTDYCGGKDNTPRQVKFGMKPKDLVGIPWMVAFALRADGWYLRSDIIWSKPNPMPESVTDRPTKSHEYIFLLAKSQRYYYNADAIKERGTNQAGGGSTTRADSYDAGDEQFRIYGGLRGGVAYETRNRRSVWTVTTRPFSGAHFATFPPDLIKPCILAGAPVGGVVLDPFAGSGTTGKVAIELGRKAILIEPKAEYVEMIERRCKTNIGLPLTFSEPEREAETVTTS